MSGAQYARSVRRVDGEEYWETLKDVATNQYYNCVFPFTEKPAMHGHRLWQAEEQLEGWKALYAAMVSLAAKEWVEAVHFERKYKRILPERLNVEASLREWAPEILDRLQEAVKYVTLGELEWMTHRMKVMW